MLGVAISPAILGSAMNAIYAENLKLPETLKQSTDKEIMEPSIVPMRFFRKRRCPN
jgi:hypothetical protein